MGYFLRRFLGGETDELTDEQLRDAAEQALQLQLDLARDVLAFAERTKMTDDDRRADQRIARARETVRTLG